MMQNCVLGFTILQWIFDLPYIEGIVGNYLKKYEVLFLYLILTIQDISTVFVGCILNLIGAIQPHLNYDKFISIYCILHCALLFYRVSHIIRNKIYAKIFVAMISRILPFLFAMWEHADMILDVIQAQKYKRLSSTGTFTEDMEIHLISTGYFYCSIASFIFPVLMTFCLILYNYQGFKVLEFTVGDEARYSQKICAHLFGMAEVIVGIPSYLIFSAIFCYVTIPLILTRHGIHTIAKGQDEDMPIDWDPFDMISKYTNSKGILELYGFKDVRSKCLPLLAGIEQLGEASIQTVVSLVFITNNYSFIAKEDAFLGVPCPVSLLSLVFSIVSLLGGFVQLSSIVRYLLEENRKGEYFASHVTSLHRNLNWK